MKRSIHLAAILALTFASLASQRSIAQQPETPGRPNIIFLLTDDQRFDTLGCMGNRIIATPNIDKLAARGVTFDNAFVTTAICMTNRACIFTGQYAARHGVIDFRTEFTDDQLAHTYPALLKKAGYYVGFIGKWGVGKPPQGERDFFDYNKGWPGQNVYMHKVDGAVRHLTGIMGDQALEFLEGVPKDRPFCLSFSFKAPHAEDGAKPTEFIPDPALMHLYEDITIPPPRLSDPSFFEALPEFLKTSENRLRWRRRFSDPQLYQTSVKNYYRLITGVDVQVGRIIEKIETMGLAGNTVIIFTSDHGFYLGERGFAGKWYAHELSIRVPLIVVDPRLPEAQRGTRRSEVALSIDMAPTMLELAGVSPPQRVQGRSVLPIVQGRTPENWRDGFFYEHLFPHARIPRSEAVRTPRWKYIRYLDSDPLFEELYDLEKDPDEAHNLAADPSFAAQLERMRQQLAKERQQAK